MISLISKNLNRENAAFTLVEIMVSVGIISILGALTTGFIISSTKSFTNVTQQSKISQQAANTSMFMVQHTRYALSTTVTNSGNTLTLVFDDDATTDSDSDGLAYNDSDHVEVFKFVSSSLTHVSAATVALAASATSRTLADNVAKIGTTAIFTENASNSKRIDISFKVSSSSTSHTGTIQPIEIVTSAYRRN